MLVFSPDHAELKDRSQVLFFLFLSQLLLLCIISEIEGKPQTIKRKSYKSDLLKPLNSFSDELIQVSDALFTPVGPMSVMSSALHFYSKSGTIWEFLRVSNVDNLIVEHFSYLYQIKVSVTSRRKVCFVHIITVVTQSNLCLRGITHRRCFYT